MDEILNYTGSALAHGDEKYDLRPYLPSQELVKAVNIVEILMNVTTPFRRKLTTHSGRN
jgi:hypothetical protein